MIVLEVVVKAANGYNTFKKREFMKKIFILSLVVVAVYAQNMTSGLSSSCAFGASTQNLMSDQNKVSEACKQCVSNVPLAGIDKTEKLIVKMTNDCVKEYFESRNKNK
ncbi:MAG: hypothetical protein PHV62_04755 [Sulfuricurvum sp.]|nr:hypothetical protein [Sulfuricurvum sp.]